MGRSALHWAALDGDKQTCELLLNCGLGCDILGVDNDGLNAADLAKTKGHRELEEFLREQF